jgi:hypothetical protein
MQLGFDSWLTVPQSQHLHEPVKVDTVVSKVQVDRPTTETVPKASASLANS